MAEVVAAERGAHVRFPPPLVFLAAPILGAALQYLLSPAPVPLERVTRITVGVLFLFSGIALIGSAHIHFSRTGQDPIPWTPTPELIFQGPYRFTRNPMYVGMTLIAIGIGVALDNLWMAVLAIPALAIVHLIAVRPEEKYLTEKFGASYTNYLVKVRRYL